MDKTIIAIDAMGGDNAPYEIVKGTINAINKWDFSAILVGDETAIKAELDKYAFDNDKVQVVHSNTVIENCEQPTVAIKEKKDSSMVMALNLVKEGKASAIISAGNTGAYLAGATLIIGRIRGVKRPCLGAMLPCQSEVGHTLLVDCGATIDAKPEYINQFAKIGSIYFEGMFDVSKPTVGLVNIGTEETKGNEQTLAVHELLKENDINFIGNIEGRDIALGGANVVVADAFVGNVILKTFEGLGKFFTNSLKKNLFSSTMSKIGALLSKNSLEQMKKDFDYKSVGGAPFLGLKGLVVKAHGSSDAYAFENAIKQCIKFEEKEIVSKIQKAFEER
ncbi:MAG: phosphate acyltransferase PlsX [Lachnospirales bacterium]